MSTTPANADATPTSPTWPMGSARTSGGRGERGPEEVLLACLVHRHMVAAEADHGLTYAEARPVDTASRSTYGTVTPKDGGRSGTLDGYYWVRDVQSGPPLGPSRSKGSEAGCRLSSGSSRRSKCPPPRFVRGGRAAGRRRSVPNGDSRRVGVAESSRSTRARRGNVDVSVVMFGGPSR